MSTHAASAAMRFLPSNGSRGLALEASGGPSSRDGCRPRCIDAMHPNRVQPLTTWCDGLGRCVTGCPSVHPSGTVRHHAGMGREESVHIPVLTRDSRPWQDRPELWKRFHKEKERLCGVCLMSVSFTALAFLSVVACIAVAGAVLLAAPAFAPATSKRRRLGRRQPTHRDPTGS